MFINIIIINIIIEDCVWIRELLDEIRVSLEDAKKGV